MKKKLGYSFFILLDILIISSAFLFVAWLKPGTRARILPAYWKPFAGFSVLWLLVSFLTFKYQAFIKDNLYEGISKIIRSGIIVLAVVSTSIIFFKRFQYSRTIVFGTILIAYAAEFAVLLMVVLQRKVRKVDIGEKLTYHTIDVSSDKESEEKSQQEFSLPTNTDFEDSIKPKLYNRYLKDKHHLCLFVDEVIHTEKIPAKQSAILNTHTLYNIENYDPEEQYFFMNLHKINDFRRLNRYFIQVNENLKNGGYFVGFAETISERYQKTFKNLPPIISHFWYGLDFAFRRVLPKIPVLKTIYFALTKGKNRALSKAEILGRLYYCGFKVVDITEIDYHLYFVAQKIRKPKADNSPSYGPLIRMRRVGKDAKIIYIYKLRTMHPYSEYLQEYMYENNDLEEGGKIKNDFRITTWGKVFRKLWIDELPQFINVLRGEIGFVGVRALSLHYFSLYPKKLQELRTKFKPGLVPPFYVDLPNTFDEILASEEKYLKKRAKHPFLTNISYFFKSWYNILIKHARSQ